MTNENGQALIETIPVEEASGARLKKIRCVRPFTTLELQLNGDVTFCCKEWTKLSTIGNIKADSLVNIWNSDTAKFIRGKMLNDEWDHICNSETCPVLKSEDYKELDMESLKDYHYPVTQRHLDSIAEKKTAMSPAPTYLLLANNDACNIKCPSCYPYRDIYKENENGDYLPGIKEAHRQIMRDEDMALSEKVVDELIEKNFFDLQVLRMVGAGDPFYRKDTLRLMAHPKKPESLKTELLTNALLFNEEAWEKIKHNRISLVDVSVDAGRRETYERVRNFGKWDILIRNLKFIGELRRNNEIGAFLMNFTVMRSNYQEILPFIFLAKELGCDSVYFARVRGRIWKGENFFDGEDFDPKILDEVTQIKQAALNLSKPDFTIQFHNI